MEIFSRDFGIYRGYGRDFSDSTNFKPWISCRFDPTMEIGEAGVLAFTGCASEQTSADVGDVNQQFQLQRVGDAGELGWKFLFFNGEK